MNRGFTLIELLVVVTIIVVLLALLAPAMDKAIYQAELAVCAANQRAIAASAVIYAMNHQRSYPYRQGVREDVVWPAAAIYNGSGTFQVFANIVQPGTGTNATIYDDRPMLRSFLSLNGHLNDRLTGKLDYEISDADAHNYSTYNLWFGYQFWEQGKPFPGMRKIGDRLHYQNVRGGLNQPLWRLDILASDRDTANNVANPDERTAQSSHADQEARMRNLVLQNQDWVAGMKFVASFWTSGRGRGPVDLNYASQDGSVARYLRVITHDPEMGSVPESNMGFNGWWVMVPPQK